MKQPSIAWLGAWLLLVAPGRPALCDEEPEGTNLGRLMQSFSEAFRSIESELFEGDDLEGPPPQVERLERASASLSNAPAPHTADRHAFSTYGERMVLLAHDLRSNTSSGRLQDARQSLNEIRSVCVNCHLRFRQDNEQTGLFPARRNTIRGRVNVSTPDGRRRAEISNVVVFLDRVGGTFTPPRRNPSISQKQRQFLPTVLPIVRGTTVDFPNDDVVFHNVFSLSKAKPFDLDIYRPGKSKSVTFHRTGLVRVYCSIHPRMAASILVLGTPYFAVADKDGLFVITDVPDGTFPLRSWHELGGDVNREITLSGGGLHEIDLDVRETRKAVPPHKNKFGLPYREKYR